MADLVTNLILFCFVIHKHGSVKQSVCFTTKLTAKVRVNGFQWWPGTSALIKSQLITTVYPTTIIIGDI